VAPSHRQIQVGIAWTSKKPDLHRKREGRPFRRALIAIHTTSQPSEVPIRLRDMAHADVDFQFSGDVKTRPREEARKPQPRADSSELPEALHRDLVRKLVAILPSRSLESPVRPKIGVRFFFGPGGETRSLNVAIDQRGWQMNA